MDAVCATSDDNPDAMGSCRDNVLCKSVAVCEICRYRRRGCVLVVSGVDREKSINGHADAHYKTSEISQESIRGSGMRVRAAVSECVSYKAESEWLSRECAGSLVRWSDRQSSSESDSTYCECTYTRDDGMEAAYPRLAANTQAKQGVRWLWSNSGPSHPLRYKNKYVSFWILGHQLRYSVISSPSSSVDAMSLFLRFLRVPTAWSIHRLALQKFTTM